MTRIEQLFAPDSISYDWNTPEWIVIHYTATDASAYNNAVYFSRGGNWNSSAHYFVDGSGTIYQSVPESRGAWHAGNYNCNTHSIGIETVSSGQDFTQSEIDELSWLVQKIMDEYDIPASHVIRHYDVADLFDGHTVDPHKNCPAPYVDVRKWATLKAELVEGDDMTDEQIKKLAREIAIAQMQYMSGDDAKAVWGATGMNTGKLYRNNYNIMRFCHDLLININTNVAKIVRKLGA